MGFCKKIETSDPLNKIYPVGSLFCSNNATSPASLFGGTWEQVKDRFLVGAGNLYEAGSTGGEATHTLTVNEMPSHSHNVTGHMSTTAGNNTIQLSGGGADWSSSLNGAIIASGSGNAHNNIPPYYGIYIWFRSA